MRSIGQELPLINIFMPGSSADLPAPKKLIPGTVRCPSLSIVLSSFRSSFSLLPLLRLIEFHALISRYRRLAMPHKSFKRCINYLRLTHFVSQFSHFFVVLGGIRLAPLRILNACFAAIFGAAPLYQIFIQMPSSSIRFMFPFFDARFSHTLSPAGTRLVSSII